MGRNKEILGMKTRFFLPLPASFHFKAKGPYNWLKRWGSHPVIAQTRARMTLDLVEYLEGDLLDKLGKGVPPS